MWSETIKPSLITIENFLHNQCENEVERDIFSNLSLPQKKISSTFFYDKKGSKLFEDITLLPEYYLTRTEIPLIKKAATYLKEELSDMNIIEFGSGDCTKISLLLDVIPEDSRSSICYTPFDVSSTAVQESCTLLLEKYNGLNIHGVIADFMSQLDVIKEKQNKLLCFLGSTIGNFSREESKRFVYDLQAIMHAKDRLLIGFDMVKDNVILEQAYNDSQQVTALFNKNILNVVNRIVETDFNPDNFDHIAFFNEEHSRIEMHLRSRVHQTIHSPLLSEPISIKKDEMIHTENSHKFTKDHIVQLAESAQLDIEQWFSDDKKWFSLVLFRKP